MTALAAPTKTWQYTLNQEVAASGTALTDRRAVLRGMKNALKGFASVPWTVEGSGNGVAAAHDGVDRWAAAGDLLWANSGNPLSWIVLEQTGMGSFQLLLALDQADANGRHLHVLVSASGAFNGGTTTARPTATDEQEVLAADWGRGDSNSFGPVIWNVQMTDDGECTRLFGFYAGVNCFFAQFEKLGDPEPGVSSPYYSKWLGGGTTDVATHLNLSGQTAGKSRPSATSGNADCRWASLGFHGGGYSAELASYAQTGASAFSGKWPATDVWAWSQTHLSLIGRFRDLYLGSRNRGNGDGYTVSSTPYVWGHVGQAVVPTGGTQLQKL